MTKIARLPDGQMLGFDDGIPDEEMHRGVKRHMGIEMAPTEQEVLHKERVAADAARNVNLQQLTQVVAKLCADQQMTQRLLQQVAAAIGKLEQTVSSAAQQVSSAVMAPVRQDIERDEDGKISATNITKGGSR